VSRDHYVDLLRRFARAPLHPLEGSRNIFRARRCPASLDGEKEPQFDLLHTRLAESVRTILEVRLAAFQAAIVIEVKLHSVAMFRRQNAFDRNRRLLRQKPGLQGERLIIGGKRRDLRFRSWLLSRFSDAGVTANIAAEAASPHEAQYLVTRGAGIALANSGAFRTSPEGIVFRLFPSELVQIETALIIRRGTHSAVMTAFLNRTVQMAKTRGRSHLLMSSAA